MEENLDSQMVHVLADSNIYGRDLTLEGGAFEVFFDQAASGHFRIVLPEVVVIETHELYRREVTERIAQRDRPSTRLRKLDVDSPEAPQIDVQAAADAFEAKLRKKATAGGVVVSVPDVDHEQLVRRAALKRRPFRDRGVGYRDALIWQSVLAIAAAGDDVAFVSANHKDFASDERGVELHRDLLADLAAAKASGKVTLYPDLDAFLKAEAERAETLEAAEKVLADNRDRLLERLESTFSYYELPSGGGALLDSLSVDADAAWVEGIEGMQTPTATDAYQLSGDRIAVDATVPATALVDFLIPKGDAYFLDRVADLGDEIDVPVYVHDFDYNRSFAAAEARVPAVISLQVVFDAEGTITDAEILGIEHG